MFTSSVAKTNALSSCKGRERKLPRYHPSWSAMPTRSFANGLAAIGCPVNGGLPEQATLEDGGLSLRLPSSVRFHLSAQERTSAGFLRAGLPVRDPASLAASTRLLLSVSAFTL